MWKVLWKSFPNLCICSKKIKGYMILSKHLTFNYLCNGFLTISPPKTAINGGNLKITKRLSEKSFQNCLQIILLQKLRKIWRFKKLGQKTLTFITGFYSIFQIFNGVTAKNGGWRCWNDKHWKALRKCFPKLSLDFF